MVVFRFRSLGGVVNRKLRRHLIARPRFPFSVQYILFVWHAPVESFTHSFKLSIMAECGFRPLGGV
jgi:hypothetical protein